MIRNVTKQIVQGKIFCVYASYKEPSGGNTINQHTVNQINSPGASAMMNSPGAVQNMSTPMTADSVEDLKLIVRSLLKAIVQLGLAEANGSLGWRMNTFGNLPDRAAEAGNRIVLLKFGERP